MSAKNIPNAPSSIKGTGGAKGKSDKSGKGNLLLIGFLVLAVIGILIGIFSGGDEKKPAAKKNGDAIGAAANSGQGAKVYEKASSRKIERAEVGGGVAAGGADVNQDFSAMKDLEYMNQPDTNILMVKTPTGYVVADSPEGQKFIADFNAYKSATNQAGGSPQAAAVAQPQVSEAVLNEIRQQNDSQVRALDEKINDLSAQVEGLTDLAKKQNETIAKLSTQIRSIQPIVKTPNQLAQDLFGKNGTKILKQRNNALVADVVVGDKAFITDAKGDTHVVRVGDVIPGTSSIVSLIDESSKQVILKH